MNLKAKIAALKAAPQQLLHDPAMALRAIGIAALCVPLVFLGRFMLLTWPHTAPSAAPPKKQALPAAPVAQPAAPEVKFYPPPATPGDLQKGYLFNAERSLVKPEAGKEGSVGPALPEMFYVGSVTVGTKRTALLVYSGAGPIPGQKPGTTRSGGRTQHLRISEGENVSGFTVASVLPDKIVFRQGDRVVEKHLFDPAKKRIAPTSPTTAKPPAANTPTAPPVATPPGESSPPAPPDMDAAPAEQRPAAAPTVNTMAVPPPPVVRLPGNWGRRPKTPPKPVLPIRPPVLSGRPPVEPAPNK